MAGSKRNILLQGSCSGSVLVFRGCTSRLQEYLEITNTRTWIESHIDGYFAEKPGEMALHELQRSLRWRSLVLRIVKIANLDKVVVMWGSELRSQGWWIEPQKSQITRQLEFAHPSFWRVSEGYRRTTVYICVQLYLLEKDDWTL